jgi:hypothetical protein
MARARVFLAYPHYGPVVLASALAAAHASHAHDVMIWPSEDSRLPHSFNKLWCAALNTRQAQGWTHFAMLHSDVAPVGLEWLDTLLAVMQAAAVQVLSCVIPVKDGSGLTSTGLYDWETKGVRCLTLREVATLPPTFTVADTNWPEQVLLVNTGCFVCDFTQPWVEQIVFRFHDEIFKDAQGVFQARTLSEDWGLSIQWARLGVAVAATRCVPLVHYGSQGYPNYDCT